MTFLFSAFFVLAVAVILVSTASFSSNKNTVISIGGGCQTNTTFSNCTKTAKWRRDENGNCSIVEYKKLTIKPVPVDADPMNGVAQCWKTPCDETEKVPTDCKTAFGARLVDVEK